VVAVVVGSAFLVVHELNRILIRRGWRTTYWSSSASGFWSLVPSGTSWFTTRLRGSAIAETSMLVWSGSLNRVPSRTQAHSPARGGQ
jgi:hypothetical protein